MRFLPNKTIDIRAELKQCPSCERRFSGDAAFCPFDGVPLAGAVLDARPDPLVGTTIDRRYAVLGVLGEGGMGRVYQVNHLAIERVFAMKVLRRDLARDDALAARFLHEARATASIKHPNVVQITDFGRLEDGVPFFVMELLVGSTLRQVLKASPIRARRALAILEQVAKASGAAHAAGIVHRDLKPDNIILVDAVGASPGEGLESVEGRAEPVDVRVVDFGASKVVGASPVTRAGVVFGTPHYMSPEQASGQPVDGRTDIYSLGVIMYEMLTGRLPFEADSYMGVLTQHMFAEPVAPSEVGVADADLGIVEAVTLRCLAKRPANRFASMDDLVASLHDLAKSGPRAPRSPPHSGRARQSPVFAGSVPRFSAGADRASAASAEQGTLGDESVLMSPARRRVWVAIVGAVLLAGLASIGAALSMRARPRAALGDFAPTAGSLSAPWLARPLASDAPAGLPVAAPSGPPAAVLSAVRVPAFEPPRPRRSLPAAVSPGRARTAPPLDDVGDPFANPR